MELMDLTGDVTDRFDCGIGFAVDNHSVPAQDTVSILCWMDLTDDHERFHFGISS